MVPFDSLRDAPRLQPEMFFCQAHVLTENDSDSIRCEAFYDLTGGSPLFLLWNHEKQKWKFVLDKNATPVYNVSCR